jgi:hypothetical protein
MDEHCLFGGWRAAVLKAAKDLVFRHQTMPGKHYEGHAQLLDLASLGLSAAQPQVND